MRRATLTGRILFYHKFLLLTPFYFMWGVSLTYPTLFYVGSFSYSYTCHVLVYQGSFYCMWKVSLTYMSYAVLCGEFILRRPCFFMWGVSLTHPVLFYMQSFSSTLLSVLCGESLMLFSVGIFWYMPCAVLCGEFLLHTPTILCGEFLIHVPS